MPFNKEKKSPASTTDGPNLFHWSMPKRYLLFMPFICNNTIFKCRHFYIMYGNYAFLFHLYMIVSSSFIPLSIFVKLLPTCVPIFYQSGGEAESREEKPRGEWPWVYSKMVWPDWWNQPYTLGRPGSIFLQRQIYGASRGNW